ncbi:DUF305 domain-containing protein [Streptomyces sp. B6B3]|uniref:DUF305 domain-containing protein n=1 Tax=Streptomyces sp. B6B3 TaxID=3153570 RepID=UPI00325E430D
MTHGWCRRRFGLGVAGLAATLALGGCTGGAAEEPVAGDGTGDASVIAPGEPGEEAETLSPEEAGEAADQARAEPNAADRAFMTMMIEHHEQALVMTDLAERHAEDGDVRNMAERVERAQEPEIEAMEAWLDAHEDAPEDTGDGHEGHEEGGGHEGHEDGAAPGMATEEQLDELRAARGAEFDRMFVDLMIAHHEGAITMATEETAQGSETTALEMAAELVATQGVEIDRMEGLL